MDADGERAILRRMREALSAKLRSVKAERLMGTPLKPRTKIPLEQISDVAEEFCLVFRG
jgi:hypothetical protein